ncbi:hypothetical protein GOV13_05180 [Candidatus Pacearchaeota archaeon]|nr:hypothetical protein [Candidatus Pacearchaeota archaeon]
MKILLQKSDIDYSKVRDVRSEEFRSEAIKAAFKKLVRTGRLVVYYEGADKVDTIVLIKPDSRDGVDEIVS